MLDRFNRFVDDHPVLYYALVVVVLVVAGLVLTGDPTSGLRSAVGEALRPIR